DGDGLAAGESLTHEGDGAVQVLLVVPVEEGGVVKGVGVGVRRRGAGAHDIATSLATSLIAGPGRVAPAGAPAPAASADVTSDSFRSYTASPSRTARSGARSQIVCVAG